MEICLLFRSCSKRIIRFSAHDVPHPQHVNVSTTRRNKSRWDEDENSMHCRSSFSLRSHEIQIPNTYTQSKLVPEHENHRKNRILAIMHSWYVPNNKRSRPELDTLQPLHVKLLKREKKETEFPQACENALETACKVAVLHIIRTRDGHN